MLLRESVALITGGASGIGAAIARRFADDGAHVAIADISMEQGRRLAREIGANADAFALDVTNASQARDTIGDVSRRFGAIDVLVNSAGVLLNKPFIDMDPADFERVVAVNLAGTCHVGQAVARTMTARGGRIINIASVGGLLGYPGRAAYAASKGGVIALTRVMAIELAQYGILVNAIAPGPVDTPLTAGVYDDAYRKGVTEQVPLARFATPAEIADVAAFLASPSASYVTGQTIAVDGGMSIAGMTCQALASRNPL